MSVAVSPERFEELVAEALDQIPPHLLYAMDNVVVLIEPRAVEDPTLLGRYHGIALTERDSNYAGALPDTITIFRDALQEICSDEDELIEQVTITVVHEVAHHFGLDDDRLGELGWG